MVGGDGMIICFEGLGEMGFMICREVWSQILLSGITNIPNNQIEISLLTSQPKKRIYISHLTKE